MYEQYMRKILFYTPVLQQFYAPIYFTDHPYSLRKKKNHYPPGNHHAGHV